MPSISSCPECHRDLCIPDLADHQRQLRCPLCDAQFAAESVLADSVNFPPEAILVEGDEPLTPSSLALDDFASPSAPVLPPPGASAPLMAPPEETGPPPDEAAGPTPSPSETFDETLARDDAVGQPQESVEETVGAMTEGGESSSEYESFGRQAAAMRVAPKVRRKSSPFGVLGQFVGMALGGVIGLAIGYYVLLWLGGPQADFLELRSKLPRWLMPSARRRNDAGPVIPLASKERDRSEQPTRSLGDLLAQPDAGKNAEKGTEESTDAAPPSAAKTSTERLPAIETDPLAMGGASALAASAPAEQPPHRPDELAGHVLPGPKPLPKSYRGPRGFRLRTASDLEAALEQAEHALRCPHCQAPGAVRLAALTVPVAAERDLAPADILSARRCDYCRDKPVLHLASEAFEQLCELAEAVTFVQFEADDPRRDGCREAAETILLAIGSRRDKSETVGRLAGERLDDSRRSSNGIVLAGAVQQAEAEGQLFAIRLLLFGSGNHVTVISRQPPDPPVARRDRLIVMGSIVDSPRDNLAGYEGALPQVVWGGLPLKLAASAH